MSDVATLDAPRSAGIISTSNEELDKKIGGGLPRGSLTLIEGHSDAGKSVLAEQFAWGALQGDLRVAVYSTENTVRNLLRQAVSLGSDLSDYYLLGRLTIFPVQLPKDSIEPALVLSELYEHLRRQTEQDVIIVDSLTGALARASEEAGLDFFVRCKELCDKGRTVIHTLHSYALNESTLTRARAVCDAHLRLRIEQVGERLVKMLEVLKVRGAERSTGNIISFDVEPGLGMRLIPLSRAKA